jgi:hypothetical protein
MFAECEETHARQLDAFALHKQCGQRGIVAKAYAYRM